MMAARCEGDLFGFEERLNVLDALYEQLNSGEVDPSVIDEISPRLLPEAYPEIADLPHFTLPLGQSTAYIVDTTIKNLFEQDRLTREQADRTRSFLGTISIRTEIAA